MLNDKENGMNSKDANKSKEAGGTPKKKKLAVVFHSQNSVNHKNHPLGSKFLSKAKDSREAKADKTGTRAGSPNGRPLPPGTARVTPLKELNERQRQEEEARKLREAAAREQEAREAESRKAEQKAAPVSTETPAPAKEAAPAPAVKAEAPAEAVKPKEEAKPKEAPKAQEAPKVQEAPKSEEAPKPAEDPTLAAIRQAQAIEATARRIAAKRAEERGQRADNGGRGGRTGYQDRRNAAGNRGDRNGGRTDRTGARPAFNKDGSGDRNGRSGQGFGRRDAAGTRPVRRTEAPAAAESLMDTKNTRTRHDATKPQKKTYGTKNFDNEKANISQRNRNNRKQNKYSAEQSYERDEQLHRPKKTGKGAFIKPEVVKKPEVEEIKAITIPEVITIQELADKMKMKAADIIKKLFMQGQMVTINTELSYEEAENIAVDYDILCEKEEKVDVIADLVKDDIEDDPKDLVKRPPVVCVMGHVDHGKTSILDAIRNTNVTSREAGGITQSIGAYQVKVKVNDEDRVITFLDTPGHEAFTAMRMRGAQSTDIAVLVVAADDGVMPQTVEAINHAKAANTPIIVAINKIDKPAANPERVKQELMQYDLVPEDYGGDVICCPVSAKTGEGLDNLLENIVLEADVMELKANPNRAAYGVVIEAELDKGRGSVARVLVQKGTLHQGDIVAVGSAYGKVRAMTDDKGRRIKKALPSQPCEILGLNAVPNAGEIFQVKDSEKEAKAYAAAFVTENKQKMIEASRKKVSLEALFDQIKAGEVKELPIVVKADVQGSVEAVKDSLEKIKNDEVQVKVIHAGVGAINESDVVLASASNAIVIGFDVKPDATAKEIAEREHVDIRLYNIIYKAIEDIEDAMKGMLAPVYEEKVIGHAVIRQVFKSSGVGNIAGSYVLDGMVQRGAKARITRGKDQIFDGEIASVKRFKDDVKEVKTGYECGLVFENFTDVQVDDMIECYIREEVKRG